MNPKRWKWYTWIALVYFVLVFAVNFNGTVGESIISVFVGAVAWFFLYLIHEIVRAFYLAFTGKMPPPITKPPQSQS